ncbi:hypothetical protein CSE16_14680 [Solibacillus sp. R5-41]|nr:hypothetical protein CSE16_14680 [Solibacillus sp. R5-41]
MHPNSINAASHSILKDISPDILKADTNFIKNGEVNIEELIKVNPEVYCEIATDEKSINKLEEAGIPTVALQATANSDDPLEILNRWLTLTGKVTGTTERPENRRR